MTPGIAPAQAEDKGALRAEQSALFDRLFLAPGDLDLMLAYATVSARLEDYEAAISTLERALAQAPDQPRVRLELGALYFNIGSYEAARAYLTGAADDPALRERADAYLAANDGRTSRNRFSGRISLGAVYSSNANYGPDDTVILRAGLPATLAPGGSAEGDIGGTIGLGLSHDYDLRRANDDVWRTEAGASARAFANTDGSGLGALTLRTGPRLSLDPFQYGTKIRPYLEGDLVYYDGDLLYYSGGAGATVTSPLSDRWSVFGDANVRYRDFDDDNDDEDGTLYQAQAGAAFSPTRDLTLTASVLGRLDDADARFNDNTEITARLGVSWDYDPGVAVAGRKWVLDGFAAVTARDYRAPEPAVDPARTRNDREFRLGLGHTFHLRDGFFGRVEGRALWRDSSIANFDLTVYEAQVSVGYAF